MVSPQEFSPPALLVGGKSGTICNPPYTPVLTVAGALNWGEISVEVEKATNGLLKAGPIRLFEGRHDSQNSGYGKKHIVARHPEDFVADGFEKFVLDAVNGFKEIYGDGSKYVVLLRPGRNALKGLTAVLDYRNINGQPCYSIVTVYRSAADKIQHGKLIWKRGKFG